MNHQILISKLEQYGMKRVPFNLLKSYLENRKQFASVNNMSFDILPMVYSVQQGSVLGPLLLLTYINDLNNAVEFSDDHHIADGTNEINF